MVNYTPKFADLPDPGQNIHTVDDLMSCNYVTFREDMDIEDAVKTLLKTEFSSAPIIDQQGYLVGKLSERDCLKLATEMRYHNSQLGKVGDYMTANVHTVVEGTNIYNVIDRFLAEECKSFPVVNGDNLVIGMVTRKQVLKYVSGLRQTTWGETQPRFQYRKAACK